MTLSDLRRSLQECPLVASVQGSPGSPVEHPDTLLSLARASLDQGVRILRLEGPANVRHLRDATGVPCMGLFKRWYDGFDVYVTPTMREVEALLETGCEMVALDCTVRPRPEGAKLPDLIAAIRAAGRLVMADCDDAESVRYAMDSGADFVSMTLAGYTASRPMTVGPDLDVLREAIRATDAPVLAEGRYQTPAQAQAALRIGASGVVIGGALNDPVKQTRWFMKAMSPAKGPVGAVDLGGTWLRFGVFDADAALVSESRVATPETRAERLDWIRAEIRNSGVARVGVSSGGEVDTATGEVVASKPWIDEHLGTVFSEATLGVPAVAANDGVASAWAHACLPEFAGRRVATVALGTGVGFGIVDAHRPLIGPNGKQPRVNDLRTASGQTFEEVLGGLWLGVTPDERQRTGFIEGAGGLAETIELAFHPDVVVACGGLLNAPWFQPETLGWHRSPFGSQAGLHGAAAMALHPWA